MGSSVKIMLSYDYCHFEICKGTDQELTNKELNEMRKDVQRLADEAVRQYKVAKEKANQCASEIATFPIIARNIISSIPASERTPDQKAIVKAYEDKTWREEIEARYGYGYDDDPEDYQ